MISLAAATMIQKAADSRIAIINNNAVYILTNYETTVTTPVFYLLLFKYLASILRI